MKNMVLQKSFSNSTPCPSTRTFYFRKVSAPAQVLHKSRFLLTFENLWLIATAPSRGALSRTMGGERETSETSAGGVTTPRGGGGGGGGGEY